MLYSFAPSPLSKTSLTVKRERTIASTSESSDKSFWAARWRNYKSWVGRMASFRERHIVIARTGVRNQKFISPLLAAETSANARVRHEQSKGLFGQTLRTRRRSERHQRQLGHAAGALLRLLLLRHPEGLPEHLPPRGAGREGGRIRNVQDRVWPLNDQEVRARQEGAHHLDSRPGAVQEHGDRHRTHQRSSRGDPEGLGQGVLPRGPHH